MQKISPMLWFDKEAEPAANHYVSIFKNSKIKTIARYPEGTPYEPGSVMTVEFELDGQHFTALNGGPHFRFDEAISFVIDCKDQAEVDYYWAALLEGGGKESQCGWLKDKFGLSWQVVPRQLIELSTSPDKAQNARVFGAMMKMVKIDVAELERAAKG
ncbi:MAG TPA: VOC family protein [Vitreimonas sp.]|uniref:VOC family protein n=1 Tax=Vitreimonas sp. TaxID=3069702 RepID=UPI002D3E08DB|nr:VOC family protein [Vitreimonas sp.]HYD86458.1 VOC family protein [Vitreimonas sp.]